MATFENPFEQLNRYELRNLVAHLEDAGRGYDTHDVLLRESKLLEAPGQKRNWIRKLREKREIQPDDHLSNTWYTAHENIGETDSYLADVARCWRLAERESTDRIAAAQPITTMALEVRYALINSSVSNLAGNIPPALLAKAVQRCLIKTSQGLTYARQTPDPRRRSLSLAALAMEMEPSLRELVLDEALTMVQSIADQSERVQTLGSLASKLNEKQLKRAAVVASAILFPKDRCQALTTIGAHLSGPLKQQVLEQAWDVVEELNDEHDKAEGLTALARQFPEPRRTTTYERALNLLVQAEPNYRQAEAIEKFIQLGPISLLDRARSLALKIEIEESRTTALSPLSARLASQSDEDGAMRLIQSISSEKYGQQRAIAIRDSAPYLSRVAVRRAAKMATEIPAEQYRSTAIAGITPYLPDDLLSKVLAQAKSMREAGPRARVLTALALRVGGTKQEEILTLATEALRSNLSYDQGDVLTDLAPQLPNSLLNLLFETARNINDRAQQIQTVACLARSLPNEPKSVVTVQATKQASSIEDLTQRCKSYLSLIPLLGDLNQTDEALKLGKTMRPWAYCARAILAVLPYLDGSQMNEQLQRMLTWMEQSQDEFQVAEIIPVVASHLNEEMIERAVNLSLRVKWEGGRVTALTSLIPFISEPLLRKHVFIQAEHVGSDFFKCKLKAAIATRLAQLDHGREALAFARSMSDELCLVNAFEGMIPYLREEALALVLKLTDSFTYDGRRHSVFAMLAPRFAELGNEAAARYLIAQTRTPVQAALAAARVAQRASGRLRADAIQHVLTIIGNMQGAFGESQGWWQAQCLTYVAPYLSYELLVEAWRLAVRIDGRKDRQTALSSLASQTIQLHPAKLHPIWAAALHHLATRSRVDLLSDLEAFVPVILRTIGTDGTAEVIKAIDDVCRWW